MTGGVRLQKYLARAGVASRRAAETLIREGRVRVNGRVAELGDSIDPESDRVEVDGRPVTAGPVVWIALHKPPGHVTTRRDPQGRPTVYALLPPAYRTLLHVGRLDAASEGLLLFTNDGDGANRLLHPRYEVARVYEAEVRGVPSAEVVTRLLRGVELADGIARASSVRLLEPREADRGRLRLVLREGRNREVRRMLEAVGHPVLRLRRTRYGPVKLGRLPRGAWRPLTEEERSLLTSPGHGGPEA